MKYGKISFTRRIPTADYAYDEVTMDVHCEDGDDVAQVGADLKANVVSLLGGTVEAPAKPAIAKPVKAAPAIADTVSEETPAQKKAAEKKEAARIKAEEKAEAAKIKAAEKKAAADAKKVVPYDREEQTHKSAFAKILKEANSGWKACDDCKAVAKTISAELNGEPLFSMDGKVIPAFRDRIMKAFEAADLLVVDL